MVFYQFIRGKRSWSSMNQVMSGICVMGGIDKARDIGTHNSLMDGKEKKRGFSDIKMEWRRDDERLCVCRH